MRTACINQPWMIETTAFFSLRHRGAWHLSAAFLAYTSLLVASCQPSPGSGTVFGRGGLGAGVELLRVLVSLRTVFFGTFGPSSPFGNLRQSRFVASRRFAFWLGSACMATVLFLVLGVGVGTGAVAAIMGGTGGEVGNWTRTDGRTGTHDISGPRQGKLDVRRQSGSAS